MPAVKEAFGVTTGMAQLTLSLGMLSMAFFTIAYGGLSDRFGRKRVLLSGLVLFTCGAATCMIAANMAMLLAGRILQGAGAGCGVVLARAIARDVYGKDNVAQVIAYLTAAYVLGPMLAPPLGGHLTVLFGWRALFVFASAVGLVVILAVAFAVPETRARNVAAPRVRRTTDATRRRPCAPLRRYRRARRTRVPGRSRTAMRSARRSCTSRRRHASSA